MRQQTLLIDNITFAKKNERLAGELALADCARLDELLRASTDKKVSSAGSISYVLQGKTDAMGQQLLQLSLATNFTTSCQRCLGAMQLKLNLNFNYLLADVNDADVEVMEIDNNDEYDLLQMNKTMDLVALIEDEMIMAMPIAPMHEETCTQQITQSGEKPNPFAVLKGLIKS